MTKKIILQRALLCSLIAIALIAPANFFTSAAVVQAPNISANGFFSADKAQQGRTVQAAIVLDIPRGFHVNANKLAGKFGIPTTVKIDAPEGVRVSAVNYPRGVVRKLGFSNEPLALYEGRPVLRFNVTVPANYKTGNTELKARVRYQACNDEVCYPPVNRDIKLPLTIVGANESVKRINGEYFGRRK
ncbi:hypothetical protein BH18ACI2_BH18ACI2_27160 [soil metagenome]